MIYIVDEYLSQYPSSAGTGLKKMVSMFVGKIIRQKLVYTHRMSGTKNTEEILCATDSIIKQINQMNRRTLAEVILIHNLQGYKNGKDCVEAFSDKSIHDNKFMFILTLLVDYAIIAQSLAFLIDKGAAPTVLKQVYLNTHFTISETNEYAQTMSKYNSYVKRILEAV
jgi:hypothetical protein